MALSVAVSLCVLGLSLSLVSGQFGDRLAPHGDTTGVDLTNRIVSFDDFGIGTGSPPAFQCFINNAGNNWYDPTGTPMYISVDNPANREGINPGSNQILMSAFSSSFTLDSSQHGLLLHRGANYYELDGLWCCGVSYNAASHCVTFTPCPTLEPLTGGVISYDRDTNQATFSCTDPALVPLGSPVITCNNVTREWSSTPPTTCTYSNRLALHGDTTGADLTNRIVSFDDFGIGTGSPPAFQCFITPNGHNWYDPTGKGLYISFNNPDNRVGDNPDSNEIVLEGIAGTGILLHRGASYYELDGLWCCGPNGGRNLNTNRCVTFTPCPTLPVLINGVITYNRDTNVATYSCDSGYRLEGNDGSTTRTCSGTTTSAGTWSGSDPSCVVGCSDLSLTNGMVLYSSDVSTRPPGTVATLTCDPGYIISATGDAMRTCGSNGQWSGTMPICRAICPDLTNPMNGMIFYNMAATDGGRLEGTVATHNCDTGYAVRDGYTRTCINDRSWSGQNFACIATCNGLALSNGMVTLSNNDFPILAGVVATHSCNDGYQLIGNVIRTCQSRATGGGEWDGTAAVCVVISMSISAPSGPAVAGSAFSLSCAVEADSLQPTITYQWLRGETVLTTGPLLEFQPHLFLSDSGEYTCRASISCQQLEQDHIISQTYQLDFTVLNIQLRFSGVVNCQQYSQENTNEKTSDISSQLSQGLENLCSCGFNSAFITNSALRCFDESTLTFRAQLDSAPNMTAGEIAPLIDTWIREQGAIVISSLLLPFEFSCPTVIPQITSEECPEDISAPIVTEAPSIVSLAPVIAGVVAGLVCIVIIIIIMHVVVVVVVRKRNSELQESHKKTTQTGKEPPVVLSELPEYEIIDKYQDGVTYEQVESSEPTKDYNLTANTAYAPTTIN